MGCSSRWERRACKCRPSTPRPLFFRQPHARTRPCPPLLGPELPGWLRKFPLTSLRISKSILAVLSQLTKVNMSSEIEMRVSGKNQEMSLPRGPGKAGRHCFLWRLCPDPGSLRALIFGDWLKCNPAGHRGGLSNCRLDRGTGEQRYQSSDACGVLVPESSLLAPPWLSSRAPQDTSAAPSPLFPLPEPALQTAVQREHHDLLQSLWSPEDLRSGVFTGDVDLPSGTGPTGWAVSFLFCFILFCFVLLPPK